MQWVLMAPHLMGSPFDNGFLCIVRPFVPLKNGPPCLSHGSRWVAPPTSGWGHPSAHAEERELCSFFVVCLGPNKSFCSPQRESAAVQRKFSRVTRGCQASQRKGQSRELLGKCGKLLETLWIAVKFHSLRIYPYPMVWPLPRPWSQSPSEHRKP